jgi:hypothetical protein
LHAALTWRSGAPLAVLSLDRRFRVRPCNHDAVVAAVRSVQPFAQERGAAFATTLTQTSNGDTAVEVLTTPAARGVRDHGPEVAAERLEPASEWFDVLPGERGASGWGLDFSVARRLAELHRGTAALQDCAGGGCECVIRLPRWRPTGGPAGPARLTAADCGHRVVPASRHVRWVSCCFQPVLSDTP